MESPEIVEAERIGIVWQCFCLWLDETFDRKISEFL
jgi:hypothetical protein